MNRLTDGGFEEWTTTADLTYWTESISGTSTVARDVPGYTGAYSLTLVVDSSNSDVNVLQLVTLVPARKYRIEIRYKMSVAGKTGALVLRDSTSTAYLQDDGTWGGSINTLVLPNSTEWRPYTLEFTSHEYSSYHFIIGIDQAASSTIYFDRAAIFSCDSCGFMWDNKWDAGTLTTSGNASNFPANNTRHRWHQKVWRSANLASPEWIVNNAGANISAKFVAVRYTNVQSNATVLIQANAADNWAGTPFANVALAANTEIMPYLWVDAPSRQYWRLAITDATNPSGYVQVGRIYLGAVFQPERNYMLGGGMRADIDPSLLSSSDDGQASAILKTKYKQGEYNFGHIPATDFAQFENLYANVGTAKPFFFCQDLGDPWNEAWYVYIAEYDITPEYNDRYSVRISLREAR